MTMIYINFEPTKKSLDQDLLGQGTLRAVPPLGHINIAANTLIRTAKIAIR